jgi:hypothetical protein
VELGNSRSSAKVRGMQGLRQNLTKLGSRQTAIIASDAGSLWPSSRARPPLLIYCGIHTKLANKYTHLQALRPRRTIVRTADKIIKNEEKFKKLLVLKNWDGIENLEKTGQRRRNFSRSYS